MKFQLTDKQQEKLRDWEKLQNKAEAGKQGVDTPYYGAIGGSVKLSFTPTSIGTVVEATHMNGETIDLSDYEDWQMPETVFVIQRQDGKYFNYLSATNQAVWAEKLVNARLLQASVAHAMTLNHPNLKIVPLYKSIHDWRKDKSVQYDP